MSESAIMHAIASLVQEGKPVSTAKVKARLHQRVEMAQLIQLVGQYKQSPTQFSQRMSTQVTQEPTLEMSLTERIATLEAKVAKLERQLTALS